jgi:adenosine kinase
VTLGERGSRIVTREEVLHVSPVPTDRAIDPIGIGDAYRAGLLKGLALGLPWASAGRIGSLAATYVLESAGPQEHFYELSEFVERFRQNFDDEAALEHLVRVEQARLAK